MNIVMLNHNVAWSGGTFVRAYHFGRQMVRRGHNVTLLTISPQQRLKSRTEFREGVRVVEMPDWLWGRGRSGWDPWDTLQRLWFVRNEPWDLVHAFDSRPAVVLPALALQRRGVPLVMDWADWWGRGGTIEERSTGPAVRLLIGPLETYFEEAFRARAQGTTVISEALKERAKRLGVKAESIIKLPQGSDIDSVRPLNRSECRKTLGMPNAPSIIGYLGTLNKSDAQLLFGMFSVLLQRLPDTRLLMIGNHRAAVPDLPSIIQTGFVTSEKLPLYLGACDLMLLPLKDTVASRGRWPSKINDYLAAGRPIVATAVGEVRSLFEQHTIGAAVPDTAEDFAEAAATLLSDAALLEMMGRQARELAETVLAWSILGEKLEAHYIRTMR